MRNIERKQQCRGSIVVPLDAFGSDEGTRDQKRDRTSSSKVMEPYCDTRNPWISTSVRLLARKWQQVRGGESIFHAALDGITGFELTHWTREQLVAAYVIPMFAGEVGHAHSPVTFKQWITTEPNAPLDKGHARYAADNSDAPFTTEDPVTASLVQIITVLGRVNRLEVKPFGLRGFMLLDGYHRAVRFWDKNDPAATLAVYVPTEV